MKVATVTEGKFQAQVLTLARLSGWRCYHTHDSRRSVPGFPDLVMVRAPVVVFAELKTEAGRVRPEQRDWFDGLKACEGVEARLWRPRDWPEIKKGGLKAVTRDEGSTERSGMSRKAGGPATEGGKEVARWNATQHGMRSPAPVVPGIETHEDWERHLLGTLESLAPEGHLETVLAERVALLSWRLHRATRYETESIALSQERAEDDLADRRRFASHVLGAAHPGIVRGKLEGARAEHRLLKRFPSLPNDRRLSAFDAHDVVLWAVANRVGRVIEEEVGAEDLLESVFIPGIPDGADARDDFEGWTVGAVRAGIEAVARATDEDPDELLEAATSEAKRDIIGKEQAAEQVARDLAVMSRERILPDEKTLEKVARYEAHLSRLLYKAMHELEALQIRRSGGAAPLARLDLDGIGH